MKTVKGYIVLFAILVICDALVAHFQWVVPGSILGLGLLFVYLNWRKQVTPELESAANTLLKYLPLCIVPVGAGFKDLLVDVDQQLLIMLAISLIALIFAVLITVGVFTLLNGCNAPDTQTQKTL